MPKQRGTCCKPDFSLSRFHHRYPKTPKKRHPLHLIAHKVIGAITRTRISRQDLLCIVAIGGVMLPNNELPINSLERIHQRGVLRVGITAPTDVHSPNVHPSNVVVEVLQSFADSLNVSLQLKQLDQEPTQWNTLDIDLLATHANTPYAGVPLRYTQPVVSIDYYLVHHQDTPLSKLPLEATDNLDQEPLLQPLSDQLTGVQTHIFDLFQQISKKQLTYTLAFSHEYEVYRHFVDDLKAEPLGSAFTFRWAFNGLETSELFAQAESYIQSLNESGVINDLQARFFWKNPSLNDIERRVFLERVKTRLPNYSGAFKQAAKATDLDWRLLAAMAYQESHWNPKAISPTGVRGMMMLTRSTAREVGVTDRQSANSSIRGGAVYFQKQKARLPDFIPEPDRTWMALAAYNLGTNTVLKAINRAQHEGENPSDWFVVQKHLSAFEDEIPQIKSVQYRRGADQGIHYVKNIRLFYDLLQRPNLLENKKSPTPINLAMAKHNLPHVP